MDKPVGWFATLGFVLIAATLLPCWGAIRAKLDELQWAMIDSDDDSDYEDCETWPVRTGGYVDPSEWDEYDGG